MSTSEKEIVVSGAAGLDQIAAYRKLSEHPAYDQFWQEQAVDHLLAKQPLKVPITKVVVRAAADAAAVMPIVEADLRAALRVHAFETHVADPQAIVVEGYEPSA